MDRFRSTGAAVAGMGLAAWEKAPGHLVTEVDMASDAAIRSALGGRDTPGDIHSEEGFVDRGGGERFWLVDPLCGTRLYAAGLGLFGLSVALIGPGGAAELGVIALPTLEETDVSGWSGSSEEERSGALGLRGFFETSEQVQRFIGALRKATTPSAVRP